MSSPSKQQSIRQLTPRRQLLTSGSDDGATSASNELIFAPQVSKESKMSVYDLDNDELESGKTSSVQVFDLGDSASEDKLAKIKTGSNKVSILFNEYVQVSNIFFISFVWW